VISLWRGGIKVVVEFRRFKVDDDDDDATEVAG
jgi:hypothetical protein